MSLRAHLLSAVRRIDATRYGDERRILVDSRTPVNYEMVLPIVRAMAADPRVTFGFTASEEPRQLSHIYRHAPPDTWLIGPRRAAAMKWDAYLTSDFMWAPLPRGAARIQVFHGVAGKYGFDAPTESMKAWDALFFPNERRLRNFVAAGAIEAGSPAARLIGLPKVDCLVDGSLERDRLLGAWGLDATLPTILYAPTWSPASSLNSMGTALVEHLVGMRVNLIVKLHDRSRDLRPQYSGGIDWHARLAPLLDRPNALLAPGANIAPYLAASDVMITDHSSAGFEYLLLDRPLVRIDVPELIQHANVHPDHVRLLAGAAHNVESADEAVSAVEQALADPVAGSDARRSVAADLFYRPGTATARAAAALYDIVALQPHPALAGATGQASSWLRSA